MLFFCDLKKGAEMKRRKILAASATAVVVAAAFSASSPAVAQNTSVQFYGHLDLSIDDITKGIKDPTAVGKVGWQADVSSNLSYFGLRGDHDIGGGNRMVFQIETQVDVAATPGPSPVGQSSPGNAGSSVKGALASRNSYLGIAGGFGAVKVGKTDAPYKLSTARMDPFSATVGDYNSIMGNSGGDNRAEFDTRLSHAAWYESPRFGGFRFDALWAPGQNRASDNSGVASGEPNCTGGNSPATLPAPTGSCTDGAYGTAYSIAAVYEAGPAYLIAAYEKHKDVNRTGDEAPPFPAAGAVGVVDEQAMKAGVQWKLPTGTTLNAIYERMTRHAPDPTANERQRNGFWLAATQAVTSTDDVNVGWAHAGQTPGDPSAGTVDNKANMYTLGYK